MQGLLALLMIGQWLSPYLPTSLAAAQQLHVEQVNPLAPKRIHPENLGIQTTAKSLLVVDDASQTVLYAKDGATSRSIASITKLMTALVFLDHNPGWETVVTMQESDHRAGGQVYLLTGEKITVKNVWQAMLIGSSNEAAVALSRIIALPDFVGAMNAKAHELGMVDSHFVDPSGLEAGNMASAHDLYKLISAAYSRPEISETTQMSGDSFTIENRTRTVWLASTNRLLDSFINKAPYEVLGAKTGYLDEAGYCMTIKVRYNDQRNLSLILLGADEQTDRWQEVKGVLDWVLRNYEWPETPGQPLAYRN